MNKPTQAPMTHGLARRVWMEPHSEDWPARAGAALRWALDEITLLTERLAQVRRDRDRLADAEAEPDPLETAPALTLVALRLAVEWLRPEAARMAADCLPVFRVVNPYWKDATVADVRKLLDDMIDGLAALVDGAQTMASLATGGWYVRVESMAMGAVEAEITMYGITETHDIGAYERVTAEMAAVRS